MHQGACKFHYSATLRLLLQYLHLSIKQRARYKMNGVTKTLIQ